MDNKYNIKSIPEEERPREKLLKYGAGVLTNSELLAIVLGVGNKEESAIALAQKILYHNNRGVLNIADAEVEDLKTFKGINNAKAAKIMAVSELCKRISCQKADKTKLTSPRNVAALLFEEMRHLKKEVFKVILLDVKNNIISIENVGEGTLSSVLVDPREVFVKAIKNNSAFVILAHNHPSGEPYPSLEDRTLTQRLVNAGEILGVNVIDHIIIGDRRYYSFQEHGYFEKQKNNDEKKKSGGNK